MAIQKSEAIVLKTYNFRETSLLVRFFARDFGKFSGLIKGIRSHPQRYSGLPQVFSRTSVVFYENSRRDLNLVTQCEAKDLFLPIREDLDRFNYASYFIELLDAITVNFDKNEELFALTVDSLKALCAGLESWRIARIFEVRLLNLSGFKPRLDACVNCQKEFPSAYPLPNGERDRVRGRFSPILGGILCARCFALDRRAKDVLRGTLASIDYIEKSSWAKALQLKIASNIAQELATILSSFLDIQLDKTIKSRKSLDLKEKPCYY